MSDQANITQETLSKHDKDSKVISENPTTQTIDRSTSQNHQSTVRDALATTSTSGIGDALTSTSDVPSPEFVDGGSNGDAEQREEVNEQVNPSENVGENVGENLGENLGENAGENVGENAGENDGNHQKLNPAIHQVSNSALEHFDRLSPIPLDSSYLQDSYNSDFSDDEFVECNDEIIFLETPMNASDSKKKFDGGHLEWREEVQDEQPITEDEHGVESKGHNISQGEIPDEEILKQFVVKNLDDGTESSLFEFQNTTHPFFTQLVMREKLNLQEEVEETQQANKKNSKSNTLAKKFKFLNTKKDKSSDTHMDISLIPRAPNHVNVQCKRKRIQQFPDLRVVESIVAHDGAIWCMEFSITGDYLATAGQDGNICIWKVNKSKYKDERVEKGKDLRDNESFLSSTSSSPDTDTSDGEPRWISKKPVQFFKSKQRSDVVALAWSKRNFLMSSSMDHRVSVWHVTRPECLVSFKHNELVTSVAFHPEDDSLFVTGSFDEKLRLFNLRSRELVTFVDTKSMITAVGFAEQGKTVIVGTYDGKCIFYNLRGNELTKRTTIEVRSRRGKNKGKKVTGIVPSPDHRGVLVTTNDSRIRIYSLVDFSEMCKFKGLVNTSSQIKASYNIDGSQIISGSENHCVYIWSLNKDLNVEKKKISTMRKKMVIDSYESFKNSDSTVTNCVFAPFQFAFPSHEFSTYGSVIATSNYKGELCIYESLEAVRPEKTLCYDMKTSENFSSTWADEMRNKLKEGGTLIIKNLDTVKAKKMADLFKSHPQYTLKERSITIFYTRDQKSSDELLKDILISIPWTLRVEQVNPVT